MLKGGIGMKVNNQNQAAVDAKKAEMQDELRILLDTWETEHIGSQWDVNPLLRRMSEIIEEAINDYIQQNPDPMDDRHPIKSQPLRPLGHLLKMITRGDSLQQSFVNKLTVSYLLARDNTERNILASRLILNLFPGIDAATVFADTESLFPQLYRWAENSESRELRAYSIAMLGAMAMRAEHVHQYRQNNITLIPIALQRLRELHGQMLQNYNKRDEEYEGTKIGRIGPTNFAHLREEEQQGQKLEKTTDGEIDLHEEEQTKTAVPLTPSIRKRHIERDGASPPPKRSLSSGFVNALVSPSSVGSAKSVGSSLRETWNAINVGIIGGAAETGNSNSSWRQTMQPILVGTHQLYPLSIEMEQRLILHYLSPISEYQDYISILLEHHALDHVLKYLAIDGPNHVCRDIRLLFDAIRYISSLLIHRKFAWKFVASEGIQRLLRVNRQSMALTAVTTCLYYLAYSEDVMEKVCHLPDNVLSEMMDYALYALDHSHESGRASIAMFLSHALHFRAMLDRFDQRDGLRRLYNYISTLTILQKNEDEDEEVINDEHYTQSILTIKNAIHAIKCYIQSHIFLEMEHIKRSQLTRQQTHHHNNRLSAIQHPISLHPHTKPMKFDDETERGCLDSLIKTHCLLRQHNQNWKPIEDMRTLGIFDFIFRMATQYPDWLHWERQGKAETLKLGLEVLRLATVSPKVQLDACQTMVVRETPVQGMGIIFELAEGDIVNDPQVQRASLEILINFLCNPIADAGSNYLGFEYRFTNEFDKSILPTEIAAKIPPSEKMSSPLAKIIEQQKTNSLIKPTNQMEEEGFWHILTSEQIQEILWKCARQNNAIMILTGLLHKKEPAGESDSLRELACRALNGIARFEPIRQILSKLPIIAANELNALMQTPILIEKRMEHNRFCEQARQLIECVSQTKLSDFSTMEMTQENLWRAAVVSQTRVKFNEKELLQLIYQHLADIGFKKTAKQLVGEAGLPSIPASRIPSTPASLPAFPRQNASSFANIIARRTLKFENISLTATPITAVQHQSASNTNLATAINIGNRLKLLSTPISSTTATHSLGLGQSTSSYMTPPPPYTSTATTANSCGFVNASNVNVNNFSLKLRPHKSLSEIVQSYFRNEHSTCRNPVANCPPFSLFYPHRCPEPKLLYSAPINFTYRVQSRSNMPYRCTMESMRQADRRLVFSKFRHWKTFSEENETFTCCQFSQNDEHAFLGTYAGEMYVYNVRTGVVDANYNCHHSSVTAIRPTKNGLLLTSSAFVKPYSVLWRLENNGISIADRLVDFKEDQFTEFGNLSTNQIVGTQGAKATVYDTETAKPVVILYDEQLANHYTRNRAYFDPLDELVLNDGILFDPRSGPYARVVHKFDKMNLDTSGVFHPRGTEVIINREVWDLRTHRLLHTVPALDQCQLAFNSTGSIIFGIAHQEPSDIDDRFFHIFGNYFRTFDSSNYEVISTHDTKKSLLDLGCCRSDNHIGVIEVNRASDEDTNFFRLYEVGRRRDVDEEDEEEPDEQFQNQDDDEEDEDEDLEGFSTASGSTVEAENNDDDNSNGSTATYEPSIESGGQEINLNGGNNEEDAPAAAAASDEDANQQREGGAIEGVEVPDTDEDIDDDDEDSDDFDLDSDYSDADFELSSDDYSP